MPYLLIQIKFKCTLSNFSSHLSNDYKTHKFIRRKTMSHKSLLSRISLTNAFTR